jgi:signal transduction histidine kinase
LALEINAHPIVPLIRDATRHFAVHARATNHHLEFTFDTTSFSADELDCPTIFVNVDRPKIMQVISNLISNGIKFSPEGSMIKIHASIINAQETISLDFLLSSSSSYSSSASSASSASSSTTSSSSSVSSKVSSSGSDSKPQAPRTFVRVEITDEGAGISLENAKKLFLNIVQVKPAFSLSCDRCVSRNTTLNCAVTLSGPL